MTANRGRMGVTRRPAASKKIVARAAIALAALVLAGVGQGVGAQPAPTRFDALIEPYKVAKVETISFPTLNARGKPLKPTRWRVISGTGNDRENYVIATQDGMLVDFGGEWPRFSRDDGVTWSEVLPEPALRRHYISYEGAVALAPGGDVVGIGQDNPMIPGGAMTFKYEAATKKWFYSTAKIHAPGLDRPALGVIPGPFDIAGTEVPYISVLRGGLFNKTPWYYSLDGLNYFVPDSRFVDSLTSPPRTGPLEVERWRELDWLQPHELIGITPYGRRKALAERPSIGSFDVDSRAPRTVFDPTTLRWSSYSFGRFGPDDGGSELEPLAFPQGRTLADSAGNLHHTSLRATSIRYLMSRDGGDTWTETIVPLLEGHEVQEPGDFYKAFRVDGRRKASFLAVHVITDQEPLRTQDLVYRFSFKKGEPKVDKIYVLGKGGFGCLLGGISVRGPGWAPCDFFNVTLVPGGRIAASFTDKRHPEPSIALQLK